MSQTDAQLQLHSAPTAVRIADVGLDQISTQLVEERMASEYERGMEAGRQDMLGRVEAGVVALTGAAERIDQAREAAQTEIGEFAVQLATEIARHVVKQEVDAGRYDLERVVRDVLAASDVGRGHCTVHMNPADLELAKKYPFRTGTELEADPDIPCGDVRVSTPQGLLVRDIDAVITAIREKLLGDLE